MWQTSDDQFVVVETGFVMCCCWLANLNINHLKINVCCLSRNIAAKLKIVVAPAIQLHHFTLSTHWQQWQLVAFEGRVPFSSEIRNEQFLLIRQKLISTFVNVCGGVPSVIPKSHSSGDLELCGLHFSQQSTQLHVIPTGEMRCLSYSSGWSDYSVMQHGTC